MSAPAVFNGFPNADQFNTQTSNFRLYGDLANFDFYASGHTPPQNVNSGNVVDGLYTFGGGVTLGSGSANTDDYCQMQWIAGDIVTNATQRLNKKISARWTGVGLSSATLTRAVVALTDTYASSEMCGSQTAVTIQNGIGFMANVVGLTAGYWYPFINVGGAVIYGPALGPAVGTGYPTLSVQIQTGSVQGTGSVEWWIDNAQIGNGYANLLAAWLPSTTIRMSAAMANGSAVAQTMTITRFDYQDQCY